MVVGVGLVGLNLSPSDVPGVKQRLGIGTSLAEATTGEIVDLLAGGAIIELDNGWRLTTSRIAGDEAIEVVLNGAPANRDELRRYGLSEEIIGNTTRWIVLEIHVDVLLPLLLASSCAIGLLMKSAL